MLPYRLIYGSGGVSEFGLGVGVFFAKKLVKGAIPRVETFFNCLTPMLSIGAFFFFFFSASSLSSADLRFGIPKVLIASVFTEDIEAEDEAAESAGVDRLLEDPPPRPKRFM